MNTRFNGSALRRGAKAAVCIGGLLLVAGPAAAQWACGGTITAGTTVTATSDILDCDSDPAITVQRKAKLDMNGYRISCLGSEDGVVLEGSGAQVFNGWVGCNNSFVLGGDGKHKLTNVMAFKNSGVGVVIQSDKNKLDGVIARLSGAGGFTIEGEKNTIKNSIAMDVTGDGFRIGSGDKNKIELCTSNRNFGDGFAVAAASGTRFKNNVAFNNGDQGFDCCGGAMYDGARFELNIASSNFQGGFIVDGTKAKIDENVAADSGTSSGFVITGDKHKVTENIAFVNNGYGFSFVSGTGLNVSKNHAIQNALAGFRIAGDGKILRNKSTANAQNGFELAGASGSTLSSNRARSNGANGIFIDPNSPDHTLSSNNAFDNASNGIFAASQGNKLSSGKSFGNNVADAGFFDLNDNNETCGTNLWSGHVFGTSDASGTADPACIQ